MSRFEPADTQEGKQAKAKAPVAVGGEGSWDGTPWRVIIIMSIFNILSIFIIFNIGFFCLFLLFLCGWAGMGVLVIMFVAGRGEKGGG